MPHKRSAYAGSCGWAANPGEAANSNASKSAARVQNEFGQLGCLMAGVSETGKRISSDPSAWEQNLAYFAALTARFGVENAQVNPT